MCIRDREIALAQAHVAASEAVFEDKEFDHDDGTPVCELEFTAGGNKYEYDVHAVTGKIIKAEHEVISTPQTSQGGQVTVPSGSTNYGNTNDGSTNDGNTNSVSYTHLDVYKRQGGAQRRYRRRAGAFGRRI